MKPSFHARLINGPFEDPSLYVRVLRESRAFLFDSGFTALLSTRDILKITDIFISHTHIDHFIGFDSILRFHLIKRTPLRLYGPEGFIKHIEGKLMSYTWNLIGAYPLVINVSEVNQKTITRAVFKAENSFKCEDVVSAPFNGIILEDSFLKVSTAILDHRIPSLAFSLEEDYHINIDKAKLMELGLPVGPWLGELKKAIREDTLNNSITIGDKEFTFAELKDIANITRGQKLSYVVDSIGSEENIRKIIDLVKGSDVLYIEAYFMDKDRERAMERYHLTALDAGKIAREAAVGKMVVFHFSPKYIAHPQEIIKEAEEAFL